MAEIRYENEEMVDFINRARRVDNKFWYHKTGLVVVPLGIPGVVIRRGPGTKYPGAYIVPNLSIINVDFCHYVDIDGKKWYRLVDGIIEEAYISASRVKFLHINRRSKKAWMRKHSLIIKYFMIGKYDKVRIINHD